MLIFDLDSVPLGPSVSHVIPKDNCIAPFPDLQGADNRICIFCGEFRNILKANTSLFSQDPMPSLASRITAIKKQYSFCFKASAIADSHYFMLISMEASN